MIRVLYRVNKIFCAAFSDIIENKNAGRIIRIRDSAALIAPLIITIISNKTVCVCIALTTIILYLLCNKIISEIDKNTKHQLETLSAELKRIKAEKQKSDTHANYVSQLYANTVALNESILKANAGYVNIGSVYTILTQCAYNMTKAYLGDDSKDFSVSVYGIDNSVGVIRRINSYFSTPYIQKPHIDVDARSVNDASISEYFYVKNLKSNDTIFTLKNNSEIRQSLCFNDTDEKIINMYSQYAATTYKIDRNIKLYVEIISYNGMQLKQSHHSIDDFVKEVLTPFAASLNLLEIKSIGGNTNE